MLLHRPTLWPGGRGLYRCEQDSPVVPAEVEDRLEGPEGEPDGGRSDNDGYYYGHASNDGWLLGVVRELGRGSIGGHITQARVGGIQAIVAEYAPDDVVVVYVVRRLPKEGRGHGAAIARRHDFYTGIT